jgi:xanthine/uracil permease
VRRLLLSLVPLLLLSGCGAVFSFICGGVDAHRLLHDDVFSFPFRIKTMQNFPGFR